VYAGGGAAADPDRFEAYALQASQFGVPAGKPRFGDEAVGAEVAALVREPLEVVQFAAGLPSRSVVEDLHRAGSEVWVYVASADEARHAADRGADALVIRGAMASVGPVALPVVIAAAELTREDAATALAAGAAAVQVDDGGPDDVTRLAPA
jgi:NAD(P)H-dependent flavin oxidoreductase YrpB (nitropropane dioxygenase family)